MLKEPYQKEEQENIRKENEALIKDFQEYLKEKDLKDTTLNSHIYNLTYFLNEYLLLINRKPEELVLRMDDFLGNWFLKKTPWVTKSSLEIMTRTIKHFYTFLCQRDRITEEELKRLEDRIRGSHKNWLNKLQSTHY